MKHASDQIHSYYGSNIVICDQLLFGHTRATNNMFEKIKTDETLTQFQEDYISVSSLPSVKEFLQENSDMKAHRLLENLA